MLTENPSDKKIVAYTFHHLVDSGSVSGTLSIYRFIIYYTISCNAITECMYTKRKQASRCVTNPKWRW